jgi:hypothetical protein
MGLYLARRVLKHFSTGKKCRIPNRAKFKSLRRRFNRLLRLFDFRKVLDYARLDNARTEKGLRQIVRS